MFFLFSTAILVALVQLVSAVDITYYESQTECRGARLACLNIAPELCCFPLPSNFGFTVSFDSLPQPGGVGEAYRDPGCSTALAATAEPNECIVLSTRAESAKWIDTRLRETNNGTASNGVTVNAFGYVQDNVERVIKLEPGQAEAVVAAYHAKDFDALSKYPEY